MLTIGVATAKGRNLWNDFASTERSVVGKRALLPDRSGELSKSKGNTLCVALALLDADLCSSQCAVTFSRASLSGPAAVEAPSLPRVSPGDLIGAADAG